MITSSKREISIKWYGLILVFLFMCRPGSAADINIPDTPQKGSWDYTLSRLWQADSAGDEVLADCGGMAVAPEGTVYFLESRQRRVHVFDQDGKHLRSFAKKGEGPGEIKYASGLAVVGEHVIVQDGDSLHYFTLQGEFVRKLRVGYIIIYGWVDGDQVISCDFDAAARGKSNRELAVRRLSNTDRQVIDHLPAVRSLTISTRKVAMIMRIPLVSPDLALYWNGQHIYSGWSDTYTITKRDLSGKILLSFSLSGRKKRALSQDTRRRFLVQRVLPKMTFSESTLKKLTRKIPEEVPYFHQLFVDDNGLIHVLSADFDHAGTRLLDTFSAAGAYLYRGRIDLASGSTFVRRPLFSGRNMLAFIEDSEGNQYLAKYTIHWPR